MIIMLSWLRFLLIGIFIFCNNELAAIELEDDWETTFEEYVNDLKLVNRHNIPRLCLYVFYNKGLSSLTVLGEWGQASIDGFLSGITIRRTSNNGGFWMSIEYIGLCGKDIGASIWTTDVNHTISQKEIAFEILYDKWKLLANDFITPQLKQLFQNKFGYVKLAPEAALDYIDGHIKLGITWIAFETKQNHKILVGGFLGIRYMEEYWEGRSNENDLYNKIQILYKTVFDVTKKINKPFLSFTINDKEYNFISGLSWIPGVIDYSFILPITITSKPASYKVHDKMLSGLCGIVCEIHLAINQLLLIEGFVMLNNTELAKYDLQVKLLNSLNDQPIMVKPYSGKEAFWLVSLDPKSWLSFSTSDMVSLDVMFDTDSEDRKFSISGGGSIDYVICNKHNGCLGGKIKIIFTNKQRYTTHIVDNDSVEREMVYSLITFDLQVYCGINI